MATFLPIFTHGAFTPPSCDTTARLQAAMKRSSIAEEWLLCCGEEWVLAAVNSIFFVGCMVGAIVGGVVSDRFGRRPVVVWGSIASLVAMLLSAAAPNLLLYAWLRLLIGGVTAAVDVAAFTLATEWVPRGWRASASALLFSCAGAAQLALVLQSVLGAQIHLSGWRFSTAAAACMTAAPAAACWVILPESPRWLHASGADSEAMASILYAAARNTVAVPCGPRTAAAELLRILARRDRSKLQVIAGSDAGSKGAPLGMVHVICQPRTWAMGLLWFSASLLCVGISLAGDVFGRRISLAEYAALSAAADMLAAMAAAWMLLRPSLGRRPTTAALFAASGASCLCLPWGPVGLAPVLAIAGKFLASSALGGLLYVYAAEVFATSVRGSAIGLCAFAARAGSVLAPQAVTLLSPERDARLLGALALASALGCLALLPETRAPRPGRKGGAAPRRGPDGAGPARPALAAQFGGPLEVPSAL